jgi:hypothetical protein
MSNSLESLLSQTFVYKDINNLSRIRVSTEVQNSIKEFSNNECNNIRDNDCNYSIPNRMSQIG